MKINAKLQEYNTDMLHAVELEIPFEYETHPLEFLASRFKEYELLSYWIS